MKGMEPTEQQIHEELTQEALAEDPGNYFEGPRLVCDICGDRLTYIDGELACKSDLEQNKSKPRRD